MARQSGDVTEHSQADAGALSPAGPKASLKKLWSPLFALGLLRTTEAIAWTSIFPYVYPMIKSFPGVQETEIPFYAGLLVAVFTFCEFLSGMLWAKLSDRIGRKPALLIGAVCGMITSLTLGISRSLSLAVASRAFGGLFNPNVGLVQTCVVELVEEKEQRAKALSFVTFLRSMGNLIGPVFGGFLADPSALYPSVFLSDSIWTTYRYLLPNLAVALLQAASFIVALLLLPETHPQLPPGPRLSKAVTALLDRILLRRKSGYTTLPGGDAGIDCREFRAEDDADGGEELQDLSGDQPQPPETVAPIKAFTLQVILQIVSVSLLAFHKVSSDAIMPAFLAAPAALPDSEQTQRNVFETAGGFGYGEQRIGSWFPQSLPHSLGVYPTMYIFTPLLPNVVSPLSLTFLLLDLWIKVVLSSIGYICSAILITNVAPTKTLLAQINGASASFSCLSRTLGPVITGWVLGVGLERGYAGIAFWTLSLVSLLGALESLVLRDYT